MATVVFTRKHVDDSGLGGSGFKPVCNRACGSSSCIDARQKNKCPGDSLSMNFITCHSGRLISGTRLVRVPDGEMREILL